MRIILLISIVFLSFSAACGGESSSGNDTPPDSVASAQPDSVEVQAEHHTSPQDAITGAYNLIDEARSVTEEANDRTEELEQLMGDI
ncbi:MAG: hypothetical protein GQ565_12650 [Candidatus Aegiribacteria sp.]|nr:hypothetical protein [Candidatus Aegiribacteria sp.]